MTKKMLIDATHPEETRVVVLDGNKVDNFDFESINKKQLAGNIYLAKVTRVEPSLQAAFVEYGGNRHGFLAFSEIHPDYYQIPVADREAILAEEEREAAAEAEAEAKAAGDAPAPKRRSRSRKTKAAAEPKAMPQPAPEPSPEPEPEPDAAKPGKARRSRRKSTAPRGGTSGALDVIDLEGGGASAEAEPLGAAAAPGSDAASAQDGPPAGTADAASGTASADDAPADADPADAAPAPDPAAVPAPAPGEAEGRADMPVPEAAAGTDGDPAPVDTAVAEDAKEAGPPPRDAARATQSQPEDAAPGETPAEESPEAETPLPDTPEDETPGGGAGGSGPRSIAESAGLDEETVTEDLATDGETQEKPRSRRSRGGRGGKGRPARAKQGEDEAAAEASKPRARKAKAAPAEAEEDADPGEVETAGAEDIREEVSRERAIRRRRYRIQDVIKVRQILLVQVVKEERGNKGAALTTYLSLAGRYCVLMPNTARGGGISRKITNAPDRKRLREIVGEMEVPRGMGLIVRTAGAERTRPEIKRDYEFLLRQWEQIRDLTLKSIAPTLIYEEGSLIKRSIRDLYSKEIESVLVEGEAGYKEAKAYMKMLMPSHARNVKQYSDTVPLFIRYQVESYLNAMFSPVVQLKSGGYIVIGVTEALVAIDVNSGRSTREGSVEDTAVKTNLEAADEVARQLRLRDLAGLIVIDFIDMDERKNNASVEKRMKERLKTDRARIQIGRISAFGLMEMSRQRLRPGMLEASTKPCPHCHGTGTIRSDESLSLAILREVEEQAIRADAAELAVTTPVDIANFLINAKRAHVAMIEQRHGVTIGVYGDPAMASPDFKVERLRGKPKDAEARLAAPAVTAESGAGEAAPEAPAPAEVETLAQPKAEAEPARPADGPAGEDDAGKSRRRRGKRGGRRRRGRAEEGADDEGQSAAADAAAAGEADPAQDRTELPASADDIADADADADAGAEAAPPEPGTVAPAGADAPGSAEDAETDDRPAKPRTRSGRTRRSRARPASTEADGPSDPVGSGVTETPGSAAAPAAPALETGEAGPVAGQGAASAQNGPSGAEGRAAASAAPSEETVAEIGAAPAEGAGTPEPQPASDAPDAVAAAESAGAGASPTVDTADAMPPAPEPASPDGSGDAEPPRDSPGQGAHQPEAEAEPGGPARPKRRGWWTLGF